MAFTKSIPLQNGKRGNCYPKGYRIADSTPHHAATCHAHNIERPVQDPVVLRDFDQSLLASIIDLYFKALLANCRLKTLVST